MNRVYRRYFILLMSMENPIPEPPPQFSGPPPTLDAGASVPQDQPVSRLSRAPLGWAILILIFAFAGLNTFLSLREPKTVGGTDPYGQQAMEIKLVLSQRSFYEQAHLWKRSTSSIVLGGINDSILQPLWKDAFTDDRATRLLIFALDEKSMRIDPRLIARLQSRHDPADTAFVQVYQDRKLTRQQAQSLASQMPDNEFAYKAGKAHAFSLAGDSSFVYQLYPAWKFELYGLFVIAALGAAGVGVCLLIYYFSQRSVGKLEPLGHPANPMSLPEADRFAGRAGILLTTFLLVDLVVMGFLHNSPVAFQYFGVFTVMAIAVVLLHKAPVMGLPIPLSRVGLRGGDFGKEILWGVAGYVAAIPGLFIAALIGVMLMKVFGQSTHPATELLQSSPNAITVAALFYSAAMVAPFWEEIMFRGTLLPALSKLFGKPVWGIIASSFLFASIHPQGIPLWLALGYIGAMSSMLAYQRKSLIPCITMHALNNAVVLLIGLLIS